MVLSEQREGLLEPHGRSVRTEHVAWGAGRGRRARVTRRSIIWILTDRPDRQRAAVPPPGRQGALMRSWSRLLTPGGGGGGAAEKKTEVRRLGGGAGPQTATPGGRTGRTGRAMSLQMGDSHRRFLQTMMAGGIVSEQEARTLHRHCCQAHGAPHSPDNLDEFVDTVNSHLQPLFMQIRKGMSEDLGEQHYALVNMTETDVTRMSSDYADNELELFRKTMDLIVASDSGEASSTDILNSADTLTSKKLKKSETEQLLGRLVHDKWLNERSGEYTLSTRCIMEMEPYIRVMYQDQVKVCHICRNFAFQCQTCENPTCAVKIHHPCVARYFKGRTEPRCPACDDPWPHQGPATESRRASRR